MISEINHAVYKVCRVALRSTVCSRTLVCRMCPITPGCSGLSHGLFVAGLLLAPAA